MPDWLIWLIAAAALGAAETLSLDLVLAMCAAGAASGSVSAALGAPVPLQFVVAVAVASVMVLLVRPVAKRHLLTGSQHTGIDRLIGKKAVVLSDVSAHTGLVRLNGGEWTARSFDDGQVMRVGETVQVMKISGATAVVWSPPAAGEARQHPA